MAFNEANNTVFLKGDSPTLSFRFLSSEGVSQDSSKLLISFISLF